MDRVFSGYVIDMNGAPIAGALVRSSDGIFSNTTDSFGQFAVLMHEDDGRETMTLMASKEGYLDSNASIPLIDDTSHFTTLITLSQGEVQELDATSGGTISFADGTLVMDFYEGGWADVAGNPINGTIQVEAKMVEPEDLRPDRLPVPSMQANDPDTPDEPALIASYGMFLMQAYQDSQKIFPAAESVFSVEITGVERFIEDGSLKADSEIPLWTMAEDESVWEYSGWWSVVPSEEPDGARTSARTNVADGDDDDLVGSDNTRYSIVTDVEVGAASGSSPPEIPRYNCDARPILSCVTGNVMAEGLHGSTTSTKNADDSLSTEGVSGAWVGFTGRGQADFCTQCECIEQKERLVCYDKENEDGTTEEVCTTETYEETTYPRPTGGGSSPNSCDAVDPNKSCQCTSYESQMVTYQGGAYTDANGHYCANVGSGGLITSATVLKDWLITETDPDTGQTDSYFVSYEHNENPRLMGPVETMCEDGEAACANWDHTIPCEWFWMNGGCAIVGGCEVFHMRGYDEEEDEQ